jgi:hypothetical protein
MDNGAEGEEEAKEHNRGRFLEEGHFAIDAPALVAPGPPEEQRGDWQQPEEPRPFGQHPARDGR